MGREEEREREGGKRGWSKEGDREGVEESKEKGGSREGKEGRVGEEGGTYLLLV